MKVSVLRERRELNGMLPSPKGGGSIEGTWRVLWDTGMSHVTIAKRRWLH